MLRKVFKAAAVWLIFKGATSVLLGLDANEEIIKAVKDNWQPARSLSKEESDLAFVGVELMLIWGFSFFKTSRCWRNWLSNNASPDEDK